MISFNEKLNDWRSIRPEFDFRLLPLQFPVNSERKWSKLFKPCATQHSKHYGDTLSCLMQGPEASNISLTCGRTAVGTAALVGGNTGILNTIMRGASEIELGVTPDSDNESLNGNTAAVEARCLC
uniref:Uncharacterized protein n=1 Tax=Glossina morsitans morsitans TaxID=37546 RepID=A0A1B0GB85_GLOMM